MLAAFLPAVPLSAWAGESPSLSQNPGQDPALGEATVCAGVYSLAQAQGGQKVFAAQCAKCHGANFRGGFGVASLAGPAFTTMWGEKSLWSLFEKMKSTMPLERPGTLPDRAYIEVLARILEVNHFPASDVTELPLRPERLERLTLPKKCP